MHVHDIYIYHYYHPPTSTATRLLFKRLVAMQAKKHHSTYSTVMALIRCCFSFTLLRSSISCLRSARSSFCRPGLGSCWPHSNQGTNWAWLLNYLFRSSVWVGGCGCGWVDGWVCMSPCTYMWFVGAVMLWQSVPLVISYVGCTLPVPPRNACHLGPMVVSMYQSTWYNSILLPYSPYSVSQATPVINWCQWFGTFAVPAGDEAVFCMP